MFGMTTEEMAIYRESTQDFVLETLVPSIIDSCKFTVTKKEHDTAISEDSAERISGLVSDIGIVTTINALRMAQDYAHYQGEQEPEEKIIDILHKKYDDLLVENFLRYGVGFTCKGIAHIIYEIVQELPYLYINAIYTEDEGDTFLEDRLDAYDAYLASQFPEKDGEGL